VNAKLVVALLFALALVGCATPKTDLHLLHIVAQPGANLDSATALDIVFVFDDTAKAMLPRTGPEWFAKKQALLAGLAQSVYVVPFQLPPSTVADLKITKQMRQAIGVYMYANYIAPGGQPVGNLTPYTCVQISLEASSVGYLNCP
jgi:type VI secretion system protein